MAVPTLRSLTLLATATASAGGCASPIRIDANRAVNVHGGLTAATVAKQVGGRGTVLFRDTRGQHAIEAVGYRAGAQNNRYVFLYTDGELTKVSRWDTGPARTVVPGGGQQDLSGFSGTLRPDALLDAELVLIEAPGTDLAHEALLRGPRVANAEDDAFLYGFLPIIVVTAPVWVPMIIIGRLTARTAADVPLGKCEADVDRALGKPDRVWPETADGPGEWRRYQRPDRDDPWANVAPIHVLFRGGRAVAAFGPGLASGLGS